MLEKTVELSKQAELASISLRDKLKVAKAKSENVEVIDTIKEAITSVDALIIINKLTLNVMKENMDAYYEQFALEFNIFMEEVNDGNIILRRIKSGYTVMHVSGEGKIKSSRGFVEVLDALKLFVILLEKK